MAARTPPTTTLPKKDGESRKQLKPNTVPLTVEQRTHRIAELYRLRMKLEEWYIAANGKTVEDQVKSKVLNGCIMYVKNRIEYLATNMNPPIESPQQQRAAAATSSSPQPQAAGPGETKTKE